MLLGAISYNLYKKKVSENSHVLIPLLRCHTESYSILEVSRKNKPVTCVQYGFFPITTHQLVNALIEKIGTKMFLDNEKKEITEKIKSLNVEFQHN